MGEKSAKKPREVPLAVSILVRCLNSSLLLIDMHDVESCVRFLLALLRAPVKLLENRAITARL
jgi:hypothetical protein